MAETYHIIESYEGGLDAYVTCHRRSPEIPYHIAQRITGGMMWHADVWFPDPADGALLDREARAARLERWYARKPACRTSLNTVRIHDRA